MKRFVTFLKVETTLGMRCPDGLLFGIGMPIGVLLLIAVIGGDKVASQTSLTFLQSAFPSLLTVGICATAFMGIPITIATYREKKILKHFFVTPASPILILFVQVCIAIMVSIISALLVAIISIVVFGYQMQGNFMLFIGAYLFVMISMFSIGLLIASLCHSVKITNVVTTFVYFPMLFLSGATIPFELFPKVVQNVANILPLTHGIKLLKEISMGTYGNEIYLSIALLLIFAIVACIVSVVSFKWE